MGPKHEPTKTKKTGTRDPSGTLQKPENWHLSRTLQKPGPRTLAGPYKKNQKFGTWDPTKTETLGKPKKWNEVPYLDPKTGTAGPNVILEKLYNCTSTFICLLLQLKSAFMGSCPTISHMFFALSTKLMSCPSRK